MARRRRSSPLEDLVEVMEFVFRYVPPWVSIPVALAAFFGISTWFNHSLKTPGLEKIGYLVGGLVALAVLIGGFGGYRYRQRHAAFLRQNITLDWVNSLSWQEFENLVGEIFRARGYFVENVGGGGADGGIDLRLRREGETTLVQCKRWKVFKVGVKPIREFFGVMAAENADRGIFVSSGIYTSEALRFAEGKPLELRTGHSSRGWQSRSRRMAIRKRLDHQRHLSQTRPLSAPPVPPAVTQWCYGAPKAGRMLARNSGAARLFRSVAAPVHADSRTYDRRHLQARFRTIITRRGSGIYRMSDAIEHPVVLGIDPGASGGIACWRHNEPVRAYAMPETEGDQIELIRELTAPGDAVAFLELVGGFTGKGQPGSAMFKFGRSFGFTLGVLQTRGSA